MSVDQGYDFRSTAGFVGDPTGCTYVLASDTYPVTTRGNFAAFGWQDAPAGASDRQLYTGDERKLAGIHFGTSSQRFRVDLGSAGTADIRIAMGDGSGPQTAQKILIKDNTTTRLTIGPHDTGSQQWYDASDTLRTTPALWVSNNVAATGLTFSSGIFVLTLETAVSNTCISHVFISFTASGGGGGGVTSVQLERATRGVNRGVGRGAGLMRTFVRRDRIFVPAYAVVSDRKAA